jgi:hydrogenase nickel incorporation protein HypA/HybF
MHEFALAEAIIATALEAARKQGYARVTRLIVRIGELQRIREGDFESALIDAVPPAEAGFSSAEISCVTEPALFRCRDCDRRYGLSDSAAPGRSSEFHPHELTPEVLRTFLRCPACRSPEFQVLQGRGVMIDSLEGS